MKTIIVPTDFSPIATNAMNFAADMAVNINASLLLLHVYQVPVSMTDVPVVMVSSEELRKSSETKLQEIKDALTHITSGKIKVYTEARLGDVSDELEDVCKQIQPFAVIMGTRGTSGVERVLFGSTTLTAIRHLKCPVIVVPPGKEYGTGIKKIGFACDFDKVVETTPIQFIKTMVKEFGAELHVLNVDYEGRHFKPETPEESLMLHTLLEDLNPSYHFINHVDIEDGINEFVDENNIDLLIAIPKKHKLLDGLFKQSSTKQLVTQAHVPVMCVHE
ncbi:MAG TPA: universal stress protein [Chitinophagaceae bacterium]|jgi:nucleotide-binding universal stress UspA family protein|nr:universal stress protein [Chitinophagaceae bacterium]